MSGTYDGNPANYPTSITIPDDGDEIDAVSVNVALEALADRTANLDARVGENNVSLSGGGTHQLAATDRYVVSATGGQTIKLPASPVPGQIHFIATTISGTATVKDSAGASITKWDTGTSSQVTMSLIGTERCAFFMWNGTKWVGNFYND